jgi:hypothetical protein
MASEGLRTIIELKAEPVSFQRFSAFSHNVNKEARDESIDSTNGLPSVVIYFAGSPGGPR